MITENEVGFNVEKKKLNETRFSHLHTFSEAGASNKRPKFQRKANRP